MDIMTGISAVAQAMNIVKGLHEIEKGFDAAEFKLKIADLYSALADAKVALADAKAEIESKQAEIEALTAQFQVRTATVEHKGYKYERSADGRPVGYPYCPICESNGKMIRTAYGGARSEVSCPKCKAGFGFDVQVFGYPEQ
jgi:hypothetical protein